MPNNVEVLLLLLVAVKVTLHNIPKICLDFELWNWDENENECICCVYNIFDRL